MTTGLQPRLALDMPARREAIRMIEAILFAAAEPLDADALQARLPPGLDIRDLLETLVEEYRPRGVNLVAVAGKWMFRTAEDLSWLLAREATETRRLPRAALETLATIAYHQPVTRAEIEQVRGVHISKGTIDVLLEAGWIRLRGRRRTPGRPLTYGTTEAFLVHFGLESIQDLPGLDDLKGAGLLEGQIPAGFSIPTPSDARDLAADEDPIEDGDAAEADVAEPGLPHDEDTP
jgi:segregation and condensation protein B